MCRSIASVVAHLTRVWPEVEGASGQDRPGPGRIPAIPPHHSPQCAHALPGSVGRLTPMTITWRTPVLVCRCVKMGGAVPARSGHRRPEEEAVMPNPVYLQGAGWVFGNTQTHDRLIRELAVGAQAAVVFPNYSLSPEAKYPTAIQECHAVAKWVAEHGQERGLDGSRIAIAGYGLGGNVGAAAPLLPNQRGAPPFRQQVLFYLVTHAMENPG